MSGDQTGAPLASEIQALVERELARIGARAALRMEGDSLVSGKGANERLAEIRGTLAQWDSLPDDLRVRRIQQIAGLLAEAPPPAAARREPARVVNASRTLGLRWYSVLAPVTFVALTAAAVVVAYRYLAPSGGGLTLLGAPPSASAVASASSSADPDRERFVLASTACGHTSTRVAQGANVGPADSEGWVVELVLLRRGAPADLSRAPGLTQFITRKPGEHAGTVTWAPATHLAAAQRFDAQVTVAASAPLGAAQASGVDFVFSGPYVLPYFTDTERGDYFKLADALAVELEASDGALFARCASADSHHLGSWFMGSSPGAAVGSLVYFMASFNEVPLLKPNVLGALAGPSQRGHAFDAISAAAASMDREAAATIIGRELGMVSGGRDHATRLTFPFRDGNRAMRASVIAARSLQLANSG